MNKHTIASEKLLQFKCIVLDDNCRTFFDFDSLASIAKELRTVVLQEDAIFNDENFVVIDEVFEFFKFVRIFIKNVRSCTSDSEHDSTDSVPLHEASIRKSCYIFCQVIANLCAKGDESVNEYVFTQMVRFGPDILAVGSALRCRRCLAMAYAITYNCLFSTKTEKNSESKYISPSPLNDRLQRLLGHESTCILRPLLLAIVDIPVDTKTDSDNGDPALEWSHILMFKVIKVGALRKLFYAVSSTRRLVTHEQIIALYLSVCVLEDSYCSTDLCGSYTLSGSVDEEMMALIVDLTRTVSSIEQAHGDIFNALLHTEGEDSVDRFDNSMTSSLQFDFLSLALQFIGSFCALLPPDGWGKDARNRITNSTDIIDICCKKILRDQTPLTTAIQQPTTTIGDATATTTTNTTNTTAQRQQPDRRREGLLVDDEPATIATVSRERRNAAVKSALQLLANLLYGCVDAQDFLRESGGLAIVLSNCFTDFDNPFAREWALVCVRNACMENASNQDFIDQLKRETKSYLS